MVRSLATWPSRKVGRFYLPLILLTTILLSLGKAQAIPPMQNVWLVKMGAFPQEFIGIVERKLESELNIQAIQLERSIVVPESAYYKPRNRWRSELVLAVLQKMVPEVGGQNILALTSVDISTTKGKYPDWGIMGQAYLPGNAAVLSTYRMGNRGPTVARHRLEVVAVHEVGHNLGLPHCLEKGCVMLTSGAGVSDIDSSTGHLGPLCREKLKYKER